MTTTPDRSSRGIAKYVVVVMIALLVGAAGYAQYVRMTDKAGRIELHLAHSLNEKHPVHLGMVRMKELLAERSDGQVELIIHSSGQLGNETQCIEQLQSGILDMTKVSTAPMEAFIPSIAALGVPYVFDDDQHFWKVLNGPIGKQLLEAGADKGLRGLCYYDAGSRSFYSIDKPILSPDDLAGMKIRVMKSEMAMNMIDTMGGQPTPVPWGELYTALQQRMVDGAENNPPSFATSGHMEVCKHYVLDEHTRIPDILLVSEKRWRTLDEKTRQLILEAAAESSVYQRKLWAVDSEAKLKLAEEKGVNVVRDPDKKPFQDKVQPMYDRLAPEVGALVKRIRAEAGSKE